jgi:hypothetical protein
VSRTLEIWFEFASTYSHLAGPWIGRFVRAVYLGNFHEDVDISEPERVRGWLAAAGCERPDSLLERAISDEVKQRLRAHRRGHRARHLRRSDVRGGSRDLLGGRSNGGRAGMGQLSGKVAIVPGGSPRCSRADGGFLT